MCDFWLTVDYVASNASVMNLLIISVDRYLAITDPLRYRTKRTKSRVRAMIAAAWIVSLVLWAPAIILWPIIEGKALSYYANGDPYGSCFHASLISVMAHILSANLCWLLNRNSWGNFDQN